MLHHTIVYFVWNHCFAVLCQICYALLYEPGVSCTVLTSPLCLSMLVWHSIRATASTSRLISTSWCLAWISIGLVASVEVCLMSCATLSGVDFVCVSFFSREVTFASLCPAPCCLCIILVRCAGRPSVRSLYVTRLFVGHLSLYLSMLCWHGIREAWWCIIPEVLHSIARSRPSDSYLCFRHGILFGLLASDEVCVLYVFLCVLILPFLCRCSTPHLLTGAGGYHEGAWRVRLMRRSQNLFFTDCIANFPFDQLFISEGRRGQRQFAFCPCRHVFVHCYRSCCLMPVCRRASTTCGITSASPWHVASAYNRRNDHGPPLNPYDVCPKADMRDMYSKHDTDFCHLLDIIMVLI